MPDGFALKDLLDLGVSGLLTFFLWQLWQRLNKVTDYLIQDREQAKAERQAIAQASGLTEEEFHKLAALLRAHNGKQGE